MAQNLFEKYGIKEVADVTLYRIERKDETYESQRKISISSILKGALVKDMVYPLDEDGKGIAEGYEAYVFKDADVLTHFNYDCDDVIEVKGSTLFIDNENPAIAGTEPFTDGEVITGDTLTAIKDYLIADADSDGLPNLFDAENVTILSLVEKQTNRNLRDRLAELLINGYVITGISSDNIGSVISKGTTKEIDGAINTREIMTLRSEFVAPVEFDKITKASLIEYVGDNGKLTFDGDTLTEGYITFTAPVDATPEEIMGRFQLIQKGLYDSLGVVVRLTQPVRTGSATEDAFSGVITVDITYDPSVEVGNEIEGTLTFTFDNAILDAATKAIVNAAKGGTLSAAQVIALLGVAKTDENVTVAATEKIASALADLTASNITVGNVKVVEDFGYNKFLISFTATLTSSNEMTTGRYDLGEGSDVGHYAMDRDRAVGTHEFSYPEQVCMLFAKNQNLITKAGTRYQFANPDQLFGGFEFDDNFATAPNGKERVVVVGLSGRISENLYDLEEVDEAIKELRDTIEAKAYDITYTDYAELLVENEMGYYLPQQLGYYLDKKTQTVSFFTPDGATYSDWSKTKRGTDLGIYNAVNTWGDDTHYSINDAIDALKGEKKLIDGAADFTETGYTRVFGGYKVTGKASQSVTPLDDVGRGVQYEDYTLNGVVLNDAITGKKLSSLYNLDSVIQALSTADLNGQVGQIRITSTAQMESNRAIYVDAENGVLANRANIYLLKNINGRALAGDKVGIFEFYDKKGNRLYYQDKVFAGTPFLTLVVIGTFGLVFVVNRHCTKNVEKVAWMINDNGYITDGQAERIVKNGLIHTVDITVCDETFDATCTVGSIKIHRTKKNVLRYVPVLFLDTLKVSTLEQASEKTDATGGRGNAKLITWDYGKEITLSIEDALYTPASMAAIWAGEHGDLKNGVKDTAMIDRMEKITAKHNFIIPAGNHEGTPSEGNVTAQAVYFDPKTMEPFQDGTPIAEGEVIYKFTRSVAYDGDSIGNTIEISADKFPGTYRVVGETLVRDKATGEDQRFQFIIPEAKMSTDSTSITLEADGDPVVFSFTMDVLRPDNGVMMKFVQFDVVDNDEENDGSTMVKDTENLNLLDDAEMYKVSGGEDEELVIGATEY